MTTTATVLIEKVNDNYPVPGVNNDSQGFRDNFRNIKESVKQIIDEIEDINLRSARLDQSNNFDGNIISNVKLLNSGQVATFSTATTGVINFENGSYQSVALEDNSGTTFFVVENWPETGTLGEVTLEVRPTTDRDIDFRPGIGDLYIEPDSELPKFATGGSRYIWKLWSSDGGDTVYLKFVGGPYIKDDRYDV